MPTQVPPVRPLFRGRISASEGILFVDPDEGQSAAADIDADALVALARAMDGSRSIEDLAAFLVPDERGACGEILAAMDRLELIDDAAAPEVMPALEFLIELEELADDLCSTAVCANPFWQACLNAQRPGGVPLSVVHGMVLENWQFLARESYFDAPVLSYVPNSAVRLAMNTFFAEENGHDEILARSLAAIGLTREDLDDSIPLPETLGLCNALAYWSLNDPLFFFTTLGMLEGQGLSSDSFIEACERMEIDEAFVGPLRTHANINMNSNHGDLTRLIFSHIGVIDPSTRSRLRAQTHLFVELYDDFYKAVWGHYSRAPALLRRVSEL